MNEGVNPLYKLTRDVASEEMPTMDAHAGGAVRTVATSQWRVQGQTTEGTVETVEFQTETAEPLDPTAPHFRDMMRGHASLVLQGQAAANDFHKPVLYYVFRVHRWEDGWREVVAFTPPASAPWLVAPPI